MANGQKPAINGPHNDGSILLSNEKALDLFQM